MFYTDFVNYLVEILRMKLFQKDFGNSSQTSCEVLEKQKGQYNGENRVNAAKKIVEKVFECKRLFQNFL